MDESPRFSPSDTYFIQSTFLESHTHTSISIHDSHPVDANGESSPVA